MNYNIDLFDYNIQIFSHEFYIVVKTKKKNLRDDKFLKEFGVYLRELREDLDLTQQQVADKMNVEVMQISRIERGVVNTSISMIKELAECLEVPVYDLFKKFTKN